MNASSLFLPHKAPLSPVQDFLGFEIDLTDPKGSAVVALDVKRVHLNRTMILHGGIHATLLDAAAGYAVSRVLANGGDTIVPCVTLSLTTNYMAAVRDGRVTATGWVTSGGYKILHAEARLMDANGTLCSTATGVFKRAKS